MGKRSFPTVPKFARDNRNLSIQAWGAAVGKRQERRDRPEKLAKRIRRAKPKKYGLL